MNRKPAPRFVVIVLLFGLSLLAAACGSGELSPAATAPAMLPAPTSAAAAPTLAPLPDGQAQREQQDSDPVQDVILDEAATGQEMPAAPMAEVEMDEASGESYALGTSLPTATAGGMMADPSLPTNTPRPSPTPTYTPSPTPSPTPSTEDMFFADYGVNPMLDTADDHLSTFALDVDTASYTLARSYLTDTSQLPPPEAIRMEEFVNFFDVGYEGPDPTTTPAFAIHLLGAPAPFGYDGHHLLRVGLQARRVSAEERDPALLIFVIDVSGSMSRQDRLGLVKQALAILTGELREDDRVGIVVYSERSRVILEPTSAADSDTILSAINALQPEGSTNVGDGLRLGYAMAQDAMRADEITRVIVLSDGVANVDTTDPEGILNMISDGVEAGITLSTIGFGMGNYNDVLMERLANDGNGNYYYVDSLREAYRVFVNNLTGTLQVVAYDARVQVDFNPDVTDRYRLIGYENRDIADEDFRDPAVDAGEVGAGHSSTALYEIALEGESDPDAVVATVFIRYRDADTHEWVEFEQPITVGELLTSIDEAPADFRLHAAAAEFAELLRESYWAREGNFVDLLDFAAPLADEFADNAEAAELLDLIRVAGRLIDTQ